MTKQVEIKNLSITCHEKFEESSIEKTLQRAFDSVRLEADHVNLVKVDIGNMPMDQTQKVLRNIWGAFQERGIDNCIFVPICKNGIQDISIERIEVLHETA